MSAPAPRRVVTVREWGMEDASDVALTTRDLEHAERLSDREGPRLRVTPRAHGVRVTASSWVGVVPFDSFDVHVVPKLAGDDVGLVRLIQWSSGVDALRRLETLRTIDPAGKMLPDLIFEMFVGGAESVVKAGLRSAYVERREDLAVLRGSLDLERQIARHLLMSVPLASRFDERTTDIDDNRLLLRAAEVCARHARAEAVRRRARRARAAFADACDGDTRHGVRDTFSYDRLNEYYRLPHELAWLVLSLAGLDDLHAHGATNVAAFMLDMNVLFERFVERLLSHAFATSGVALDFQPPSGQIIRGGDDGRYRRLIPDVLAKQPGAAASLPIDAKYKRYSHGRVETGDLAQTFLYASGFGVKDPEVLRSAVIVYPSEAKEVEAETLSLRHVSGGKLARVLVLGVPIVACLDEVAAVSAPSPIIDSVRGHVAGVLPDASVPPAAAAAAVL